MKILDKLCTNLNVDMRNIKDNFICHSDEKDSSAPDGTYGQNEDQVIGYLRIGLEGYTAGIWIFPTFEAFNQTYFERELCRIDGFPGRKKPDISDIAQFAQLRCCKRTDPVINPDGSFTLGYALIGPQLTDPRIDCYFMKNQSDEAIIKRMRKDHPISGIAKLLWKEYNLTVEQCIIVKKEYGITEELLKGMYGAPLPEREMQLINWIFYKN